MSDEILSGLKVLVALAKADGVVHDNERLAIENALDGIELDTTDGQGTQAAIDSLLAMDVDLESELARITSPRVKQQTFDSACAIVYVDGEASDVERALLEKVRSAFELGDQEAASLRFKAALHRAFAPLAPQGDDGRSEGSRDDGRRVRERDVAVEDEITRFALLGASLASLPLPSFCAGINLTNEVRLARKIAMFYGHRGDSAFWKTFVTNIVGSAGSWLAISALARLAGLGSRANGAYASAYALGKVTELYFEKQEAIDTDALRAFFKDAKKKGQTLAKEASAKIAEKTAEVEKTKRELDTLLLDEKISETEYEERLVVLA